MSPAHPSAASPLPSPAIESAPEAIPAPIRAVLALFAAELRGVSFPGADAALLGQRAEEVRSRARDVERAQAALDAAIVALEERSAALAALAARALAYARIYAADHPALVERLADLDLDGERPSAGISPRAPLRRRRTRGAERPELPLGELAPAEE
jgi:hypothetical protein